MEDRCSLRTVLTFTIMSSLHTWRKCKIAALSLTCILWLTYLHASAENELHSSNPEFPLPSTGNSMHVEIVIGFGWMCQCRELGQNTNYFCKEQTQGTWVANHEVVWCKASGGWNSRFQALCLPPLLSRFSLLQMQAKWICSLLAKPEGELDHSLPFLCSVLTQSSQYESIWWCSILWCCSGVHGTFIGGWTTAPVGLLLH